MSSLRFGLSDLHSPLDSAAAVSFGVDTVRVHRKLRKLRSPASLSAVGCSESPSAAMDGNPIGADPALAHRLPMHWIAQEFEAAAANRLASLSAKRLSTAPDHHLVD